MEQPLVLQKPVIVALVGNPNCGKTTLFNRLTGSRQRVGNSSGVTVTRKEGDLLWKGRLLRFVDLPGLYSLATTSPEESLTRDYLLNARPDVVVNVLDAGNLERNLFLSCQLLELGSRRLFCLNMMDEAREKGVALDGARLASALGGPVVETNGREGTGLPRMLEALLECVDAPPPPPVWGLPAHGALVAALTPVAAAMTGTAVHWRACRILEGAEPAEEATLLRLAHEHRTLLEHDREVSLETLLAEERYAHIRSVLNQCRRPFPVMARPFQERLDGVLLHPLLGLPLFLLVLWAMFQGTFTLGEAPASLIEAGTAWCVQQARALLPDGLGRELLADGILNGLGSILVFLPNILLLFFFISLLEESGYMARAAFLMDRAMRAVGLQGKAFIPLLMGFGCNVPAIMATRILEHPGERLLTILINPFISCSARLPVFVLFCGAFFPGQAGSVLFLLYLTGMLAALLLALGLRKTLFRELNEPFLLELPPYRIPTFLSVAIQMWDKAAHFLRKVGGVILVGAILVWAAQSFPQEVPLSRDYDALRAAADGNEPEQARLARQQRAEEQEQRYLGRIGHAIAPLLEPLGLDWKASVALLTGFVAKEVVVSTLGVLHQQETEEGAESGGLRQALAGSMEPGAAAAFMVFTLLYTPCLSTVAVIRRETGSTGWTLFSVLFSLVSAWCLAWGVHGLFAWLA